MKRRRLLEYAGIGITAPLVGAGDSAKADPLTTSLENPIEISDVDELQDMQDDLTADYVLVDDIDASETEDWNDGQGFEPIGDRDFPFVGSLDGQSHEISGLHIERPSEDGVGLFGHVEDGVIENIGLPNADITGGGDWLEGVGGLTGSLGGDGLIRNSHVSGQIQAARDVGGIAGWIYNFSEIRDSYSIANVTIDEELTGLSQSTGGLSGRLWGGTVVSDSYATGEVSGPERVGGLVGYHSGNQIENSYATGSVNGSEQVGGLVGESSHADTLRSFATGKVSGTENVGGLVGYGSSQDVIDSYALGEVDGDEVVGGLVGNHDGKVESSYSSGKVTGEEFSGGLIGWSTGEVENSYWDIESSEIEDSAGGTEKTTDEMTDIDIYEDADWDIEITDEDDPTDGYPFLSWELDSSPVWYIYGELFDMTINVEGAGTTDPEPGTYTHTKGEEVSLTASPDTGWEFVGWSGDIENENQEIEIAVEEDVEIIAEFERQEYELSIELEGEGSTNPEEGQHTYEFGEEVEVEATPQDGWRFVGWSGDVQSNEASLSVTIEEDTEIIAEFERQEFEMEISVEGEGTTDPEEGKHIFEFGNEVVVDAIPDDGWEFSGWAGDIVGEDQEIEITVEEDLDVVAEFERREYELSINVEGDGNTTPEAGQHTYEFGEEVEIEATPHEGWKFESWSGDVQSDEVSLSVTIEEDTEIIAEFQRKEFELSIGVEGEGSTSPEESQYIHEFGKEVSIIATPDDGWEFSGWAGDIADEDDEIELTIEEDMEVIAEFERKEYELTIEIDGEGSTSITEGVHTFEFEEEVELEATPETGWEFVGWTGDVESEETLITVAIEEDMEIIANFSQEETPTPTPTPTEPTPTPSPTPPDSTPTPTPGDPTPMPTPTREDDSIPGFGWIAGLSGIGGAAYVLKRRLDTDKDEIE